MPETTQLGIAQVPIRATLDGLERDLASVKDRVESTLGKLADRVSKDYLDLGDKVNKGLAIASGALIGAVTASVGALASLAISALPLQGIIDTFGMLSGDSETMSAALSKAALGMMDNTDLMAGYNREAQLAGKTIADQLPTALQYLAKVAYSTGQDIGTLYTDLVEGIGRARPMMLAQLGVEVSLEEASEKWALAQAKATGRTINNSAEISKEQESLATLSQQLTIATMRQSEFTNKTSAATRQANAFQIQNLTEDIAKHNGVLAELVANNGKASTSIKDIVANMTKAQQQEALMAAVIEKLRENTAKMPEVVGTATQKWAALKTKLAEVKEHIGLSLIPALTNLLTPLGNLADRYLPRLTRFFDEHVSPALIKVTYLLSLLPGLLSGAGGDLVQKIGTLEGIFLKIGETLGIPREKLKPFLDTLADLGLKIGDLIPKVQDFAEKHGPALKGFLEGLAVFLAGAGIAAALTGIVTPINLLIVAAGLLGVAWEEDWGGIQEKFKTVWTWLERNLARLALWLSSHIPVAISVLSLWVKGTLLPKLNGIWTFVTVHLVPAFRDWNNSMEIGSVQAMEALGKAIAFVREHHLDPMAGVVEGIAKAFDWLAKAIQAVLDKLREWNNRTQATGRTGTTPGVPAIPPGVIVPGMAAGGEITVRRPTWFLAGERYQPERVVVTPMSPGQTDGEGAGAFQFVYNDYTAGHSRQAQSMAREWQYRYQMGLYSR